MSTARLTYPAPHRNMVPTGTQLEHRRDWKLVKEPKSKYNIFGLSLQPIEIKVHQRIWTSEPWTVESALAAIQAGAWFTNDNEFESKAAKAFAMAAQSVWEVMNHAS